MTQCPVRLRGTPCQRLDSTMGKAKDRMTTVLEVLQVLKMSMETVARFGLFGRMCPPGHRHLLATVLAAVHQSWAFLTRKGSE